jgi:kinesin family protein 1
MTTDQYLFHPLRVIHLHSSVARVSGAASESTFDPTVPPEKQKVTYQTKDGRIKTVTKAELQEQMETSEKLMQSLNETWEEKLQRTQEVQKEREKALEDLGITVEKNNVGVHTPKKVRNWSRFLSHSPGLCKCRMPLYSCGRAIPASS